MRAATVFVALSALVASVVAQYPDCANPCIQNADVGSCFSDDLNCLCKSPSFINSTTKCIVDACSPEDTLTAQAVAQGFCLTVGVTLASESPSQTGTTSGAGSSTASNSATTTSGAPSKTPSPPPSPAPTTDSGAVVNGVNVVLAMGAVAAGALLL
ncbi:hypothetical protein BXZ70DRAFT_931648 [Cristinia sonorae]|uniref:CFEM domain-containing protein n=1 Tax=Cristinia sonorae TaxID=1940300 RepID=A0A8K0XR14_9AGAR|nr:hypothetical protein BXZ70DRAFT_931648 [Cristinia sonorae]